MRINVWSLPGPRAFVEAVVRDLQEGTNVVVAMPDGVPAGVPAALRGALGDAWDWRALSASSDGSPAEQIVRRFVPAGGRGYPTARLVADLPGMAGRILWVDGVGRRDWGLWCDFLSDFAHAAQARQPYARLRLAVASQGLSEGLLPGADVGLHVHLWQGAVSGLDMLLYCALINRDRPPPEPELISAVVARLALWDIAVADALSALPAREVLEPEPHLRALAAGRGWERGQSPRWETGTRQIVDGRWYDHSLLLAADGGEGAIRERIWAAQAGVLLPLIEQRRQELARRSQHLLRLPWETLGGVVTDPLDLEVNDLYRNLRHRAGPATQACLDRLRRVRNALAHCESVTVEDALAPEIHRSLAV